MMRYMLGTCCTNTYLSAIPVFIGVQSLSGYMVGVFANMIFLRFSRAVMDCFTANLLAVFFYSPLDKDPRTLLLGTQPLEADFSIRPRFGS